MIITGIVFAIIGFILAWYYAKTIVLFATSFLGSYEVMKGLSFFFGGYPDEIEIYFDITEGQFADLEARWTNWCWLYLGIWVAGFVVCLWYQVTYTDESVRLEESKRYQKEDDKYSRFRK